MENLMLNWRSVLVHDFPSGYTVSSKKIIQTLVNLGSKVSYLNILGDSPYQLSGPDFNVVQSPYDTNRPEVIYSEGGNFIHNKGSYKIGFSMLEVNGIPEEWVRQCNSMDEVWVPSYFNMGTFRDCGVNVPIITIPLGIDSTVFYPHQQNKRLSPKFTFLSVMCWSDRKKPDQLIEAFLKAFEGINDVILVCKVNSSHGVNVLGEIKKLGFNNIDSKIKILQNNLLSDSEMGNLYRAVDCLIHPTKGEGFGMPILEAMACGVPTISTDWGGQKDFMNKQTGYPIRVKQLVPTNSTHPLYKDFKWADLDIDHMIELMRYVYVNRVVAKERSTQISQEIRKKWTWENTAQRIITHLKNLGF